MVAAEQQIGKTDIVAVGWAHAFRTPGDPGQHNDCYYPAPYATEGDVTGGPHVDNSANMITADVKHILMPGLTWYTDVAATLNTRLRKEKMHMPVLIVSALEDAEADGLTGLIRNKRK